MQPNTEMEIINPNENLSIPEWINADYFKDILSQDEPGLVAVKQFTPIAATAAGENYTSIMLRIHMDLLLKDETMKHKKYVLKTMLDQGGDIIKDLGLFPKEAQMYQKYLPAFEKLYAAVGWNIQFAPKCLAVENKDDRITLIFEDLGEKNYKNIDRLRGCDMDHMEKILRKLAEYHAASAVYQERNGDYPKEFQMGYVDPQFGLEFHQKLFTTKETILKKCMQLWGLQDVEKYLQKFPSRDQYWKCCLAEVQPHAKNFNVLNHGDFWSNNIMFSYLPDGELNELLFVDFQICKWSSPAKDLLFLITVSAANSIRVTEFDHFIAVYHERLVECLKVLDFAKPLPKLRDLHKDIFDEKNSFYAFFACFNHLPLILLPSDKDASIDAFHRADDSGEKFRMKVFTNPLYVEAMKDLIPFYYKRGVFDFTDFEI